MPPRTITIDAEAYHRLKSVKGEAESFSQTIKRVVPAPITTDELIALFRRAGSELSEGFYRGVEAAVAARPAVDEKERMDGLLGHHGAARSGRSKRSSKTGRRRGTPKTA